MANAVAYRGLMFQRTMLRTLTIAASIAAGIGCGGKKPEEKPAKHDAAPGPTVAPIAVPTSGVDSIARMNYRWTTEHRKALQACCKGKPDWPATKAAAEAALAKDPQHIGAHWLVGVALAQAGDHAAAVDHLVQAIAADYPEYAPKLGTEKALEAFLATPHGIGVKDVAAKIAADYKQRAATGMLLVGRRSAFRWPEKDGVQYSSSRGELYAYDRDTRRYLRLTHTDDSVVGFVRAPSGSEVAVLGFDRIDRPKGEDPTPLVVRGFVIPLDTKEWAQGARAVVPGPARELALGYGEGDQLLVATAPAAGRWGAGAPVVSSVDRTGGKLTKVATAMPAHRIVFSLEEGRVLRVPDGVTATWAGDPPTAASVTVGSKVIAIPESGQASQSTVALGATHVAFATAVDPCAKDAAPSLYVADVKTGALKHLLTAKSRFTTRWVTPSLLAYEDGDGAIRLWDVTTGREASKLENKAGIALDVLSLAKAPLCKGTPPQAEPPPGDGPDELPPEEPAPTPP